MIPQFQNICVSQYGVISIGDCQVFVGLGHPCLQTLKVRHTPAPLLQWFLMLQIFPSWNPPPGLAQRFGVRDISKKPKRASLPWSGGSHSGALLSVRHVLGTWAAGLNCPRAALLKEAIVLASQVWDGAPVNAWPQVFLGYLFTVTSGRERLWERADIHAAGLRGNSTRHCKWKNGNSDI